MSAFDVRERCGRERERALLPTSDDLHCGCDVAHLVAVSIVEVVDGNEQAAVNRLKFRGQALKRGQQARVSIWIVRLDRPDRASTDSGCTTSRDAPLPWYLGPQRGEMVLGITGESRGQ